MGAGAQPASSYLSLQWSNDLLYLPDQTDQYYTNGVNLDLSFPGLANFPLRAVLLRGPERFRKQYGLRVVQDIFTPVNKDTLALLFDDRPFASYLTGSLYARSSDPVRRLQLRSELQLGVLGRFAGGAATQNFIHAVSPGSEAVAGWDNEVNPDLVLNYNIAIEKGLLQFPFLEADLTLAARAGTLHTDLKPSARIRLGLFDDVFTHLRGWSPASGFRAHLYGSGGLRLVGYDATLQGGLFNRDDRFRENIEPERLRQEWDLGLELSYRRFSVRAGAAGTTPEFTGGQHHRWGYLVFRMAW